MKNERDTLGFVVRDPLRNKSLEHKVIDEIEMLLEIEGEIDKEMPHVTEIDLDQEEI